MDPESLGAAHGNYVDHADPRQQLAAAYKEARAYWAQNPGNTKNAPTRVQQRIEEWLMDKHLLPNRKLEETVTETGPMVQAVTDVPRPLKRLRLKLLSNLPSSGKPLARSRSSQASLPSSPLRLLRRLSIGRSSSRSSPATPASAPSPQKSWRKFVNILKPKSVAPTVSQDSVEVPLTPTSDKTVRAGCSSNYTSLLDITAGPFDHIDAETLSYRSAHSSGSDDDDDRTISYALVSGPDVEKVVRVARKIPSLDESSLLAHFSTPLNQSSVSLVLSFLHHVDVLRQEEAMSDAISISSSRHSTISDALDYCDSSDGCNALTDKDAMNNVAENGRALFPPTSSPYLSALFLLLGVIYTLYR